MKIVTFLGKNGETSKRVVDFLCDRDTFRKNIWKIVEDFDEKKVTTTNGKLWKIVEGFTCEAKNLHFFIVHHFSSILMFSFFLFSFFLYFYFSFSFSFFSFCRRSSPEFCKVLLAWSRVGEDDRKLHVKG